MTSCQVITNSMHIVIAKAQSTLHFVLNINCVKIVQGIAALLAGFSALHAVLIANDIVQCPL